MKQIGAIVLLTLIGSQLDAQLSKGVNQSDYGRLEQVVKLSFGETYRISSIVNPDSLYPGRFTTLRGCMVFGARSGGVEPSPPFVGIAQGNALLWTSEREADNLLIPEIDRIVDMNNDGKPKIFVLYAGGVSSTSYELWIYSWEGTSGVRVNPVSDGSSTISELDSREGYEIVDTGGDGVKDVRIYNAENETIYFHWDGAAYQQAPQTPTVILPRNRLSVDLRVRVTRSDNSLSYRYSLFNRLTSLQSSDDFLLEPACGLHITGISGRANWKPASGPSFVRWTNLILFGDNNFVRPGELDSSFSIQREGVPRIGRYYVQGHNGDDFSGSGILTNSATGFTVTPSDSLLPFVPLDFLDTLMGYTTQSRTIGWVKDQPTSDKYAGYFATGKTSLRQNDVGSTRATLQQVLRDVNADSTSKLTSEAYALIRYNTEYLLSQLPAARPPVISSLTPATAIAGSGAFTLSISGSYFVSGAVVTWKGSARTTTFVSEAQLRASIPATDVAAVDSPLVGVKNPDGNQSNTLRFKIIKTVSMLLDDLRLQLTQLLTKELIGDEHFMKELDNGLDNAKKHLSKPDSVNCYKEVATFQDKVNKEYLKTVDNKKNRKARDKRFVSEEGWNVLYYGAQEIMDRLPSGKKK